MRKLLALLVIAPLLLAGCQGEKAETTEETTVAPAVVEDASAPAVVPAVETTTPAVAE